MLKNKNGGRNRCFLLSPHSFFQESLARIAFFRFSSNFRTVYIPGEMFFQLNFIVMEQLLLLRRILRAVCLLLPLTGWKQ